MKKYIKILICFLLCFTMVTPFFAYGNDVTTSTKSIYTGNTYKHNAKFIDRQILQGIDVSSHNGDLDWAKIKAGGTEFAILRAACRGYADEGTLFKDKKFDEYIKGAKAQNIPVGAYIYSQALTVAEAEQEANYILNVIKGYSLDLPVVFDYEFAGTSSGRMEKAWANKTLTKAKMTANALAFCNKIVQAGYQPMVYANKSFFYNQLDYSALEAAGIKIWLAHYTSPSTDYKGDYSYWQYSSGGKIAGINGVSFDSNFLYKSENDVLDDSIFRELPGAVTNLALKKNSETSVTLTWNAVPDALGYTVYNRVGEEFVEVSTINKNSITLSNLAPLCQYNFMVQAYNKSLGLIQYGTGSNEVPFWGNLSAAKLSYTSTASTITLKWTKVAGATGYKIYKYDYKNSKYKFYKEIKNGSTTSAKYTDLNTNAKYRYRVLAYGVMQDGTSVNGPYSAGLTCYTKPRAPKLNYAKYVSSKTIKTNWSKTSDVSGYEIQWSTKSNFASDKKSVTAKSNVRTKNIKTAKAKKYYYVRIRSYKTRGGVKYYSSWTSAKKVYVKK